MRVVALGKAAAAGVAGAVAWEIGLRTLILAGVPTFDIVATLGRMAFPDGPTSAIWLAGMTAHAAVGIAWAVFYAYFFWARFNWPPAIQGALFSLLPTTLALFVMAPQMRLAHLPVTEIILSRQSLSPGLSWPEIGGLVLGHLLYGLTVGWLYTHPVGYRAGRPPRLAPRRMDARRGPLPARSPDRDGFIFATGIECSYPTIEHGRWRFDQMASTGHYRHWKRDFELCREIGITHLRYGPPLHLIFEGPGQFDWSRIDEPMAELQAAGPEPIVDLCHFGVPSWLGDFQNREIVAALAEYAGAFARRYPWVRFYTPVNEMYVCARMSALDGVWNEQLHDEGAFINAVFNVAAATAAMTDAILVARPDAVFVNSESSEFSQPCCPDPDIQRKADFENQRRFLPLDLIFGHEVGPLLLDGISAQGREADYARFRARQAPRRSILGVDYYEWNERLIDRGGQPRSLGELFGWYVIANQYFDRYRRPMMHTETNRLDPSDGPRWLWRQWHNVQLLRAAGVPLVGFTWYSLVDQVDWEIALAKPQGTVDAVGLVDLNRDPRAVGLAYRHLIGMHRDQPGYDRCDALAEVLA